MQILLFLLAAALLLAMLYAIWRLWWNYTRVTPEDEELENRIATLNDRQANRVSDEQLVQPLNTEDAWYTMVRRGRGRVRGERSARRRAQARRAR